MGCPGTSGAVWMPCGKPKGSRLAAPWRADRATDDTQGAGGPSIAAGSRSALRLTGVAMLAGYSVTPSAPRVSAIRCRALEGKPSMVRAVQIW